jgi:flavin reductase (DIM6/NTAB) family NADH-FMN oxidoreductase RutF
MMAKGTASDIRQRKGGPGEQRCQESGSANDPVWNLCPHGGREGSLAAATVNWVTQSAFTPPLVVVGIKADSGTCQTVKAAQAFALNMLGKEQKAVAFTFFRPTDVSDGKLSGQPYRSGATGAPLLIDAVGAIECRVTAIVEQGDHHIVVGEVVEAHLNKPLSGRPDAAILEMKDLGDNVFYGG